MFKRAASSFLVRLCFFMVFSSVMCVFPFGGYIFALNACNSKLIQSRNVHKYEGKKPGKLPINTMERIHARNEVQAAAGIPSHEDLPRIINTLDGSGSSFRRGLDVIHRIQHKPGACRIDISQFAGGHSHPPPL
nr:MAG TPA: hypothetical protein [Caudoviricetes sp.]